MEPRMELCGLDVLCGKKAIDSMRRAPCNEGAAAASRARHRPIPARVVGRRAFSHEILEARDDLGRRWNLSECLPQPNGVCSVRGNREQSTDLSCDPLSRDVLARERAPDTGVYAAVRHAQLARCPAREEEYRQP